MSDKLIDASKLKDWIDDPQWQSMLISDRFLEPDINKAIASIVESLKDPEMPHDELGRLLDNLHINSLKWLSKANEQTDPVARWHSSRVSYAYYAMGEVITEGSTFSNTVIESIKHARGENYLNDLSRVDRVMPSHLTNIASGDIHEHEVNDLLKLKAVRNYLVLKEWQDKQHLYHENELFPAFKQSRQAFKRFIEETYPNLQEISERDALFTIENIYVNRPLNIKEIVEHLENELISEDALSSSIGGKALGLARLAKAGAKIPKTYIVPAATNQNSITAYLPNDEPSNLVWAVRSSATAEDGREHAFAGIFESYLRVPSEHLYDYIQKVIGSALSNRAKTYISKFNLATPEMAVLIQEFNEPDVAGVWLGDKQGGGQLEWVNGDGEKLVSGKVTPANEIWHNNSSDQMKVLTADGIPVGVSSVEMQKRLGVNSADFEFCIIGGKLVWLQYRPVTKEISAPLDTAERSGDTIYGRAASAGIAHGEGYVAESPDKVADINENNILICDVTDPDWLEVMIKAGGILTSEGGVLCHAAITARELGKPAVVGAGDGVFKLSGKVIELDGGTGRVRIAHV